MIYQVSDNGVVRDATPDEAAEIDMREHAAELAAQNAIRADMDAYLADVRSLRERLLNRISGIATAALALSDQDTIDAFVAARQRLLDITKVPAALAATNRAQLETAIKAEYVAIVQSVPASLIAAFDQVDE